MIELRWSCLVVDTFGFWAISSPPWSLFFKCVCIYIYFPENCILSNVISNLEMSKYMGGCVQALCNSWTVIEDPACLWISVSTRRPGSNLLPRARSGYSVFHRLPSHLPEENKTAIDILNSVEITNITHYQFRTEFILLEKAVSHK